MSLTCGDLGVTALEVERKLHSFLRLGEGWDAVVLLDEADIYLEARDLRDIKRNSLVSGTSPSDQSRVSSDGNTDIVQCSLGNLNTIEAFCSSQQTASKLSMKLSDPAFMSVYITPN